MRRWTREDNIRFPSGCSCMRQASSMRSWIGQLHHTEERGKVSEKRSQHFCSRGRSQQHNFRSVPPTSHSASNSAELPPTRLERYIARAFRRHRLQSLRATLLREGRALCPTFPQGVERETPLHHHSFGPLLWIA